MKTVSGVVYILVIFLLAGVETGCAPSVVMENPRDWPQSWHGRQLYTTPNACIYSSGGIAAGEADRLVARVGRDFRSASGVTATRGLVIVNDAGDGGVTPDILKLLVQAARTDPTVDEKDLPSESEIEEVLREANEKAAGEGFALADFLQTMPLPLPSDVLSAELALGESVQKDTDWAVMMPTRAAIRKGARSIFRMALSNDEIGPVAKVAMAPLLALAEPACVEGIAVSRDIVIFERLVNSSPSLDETTKKQLVEAYRQRKERQVAGPFGHLSGAATGKQKNAKGEAAGNSRRQ